MARDVPPDLQDVEAAGCLLQSKTIKRPTYDSFLSDKVEEHLGNVTDNMTYDMVAMKSWRVLLQSVKTVWDDQWLWTHLMQLLALALGTAFLAYNGLPDPGHLDTEKFGNVCAIMTVFVSLSLSFFLSSAVNRWLTSVDGFEQIFNSVRMLSFQLHALGAESAHASMCLRYALMSAHFLVLDLVTIRVKPGKRARALTEMLQAFENAPAKYAHLTTKERAILEKHVGDKPFVMWVWVSTLFGRMAMEKEIPGMATSTYGRIMNLAQQCQEGLRTVRAAVLVQMPYRYVHILAFLVHLECIFLAINLGLALGVSFHGFRLHVTHYYLKTQVVNPSSLVPLTTQIQTLIVETLKGVFAPILYEAFFAIGVAISSPFSTPEAAFPVERMIEDLSRDLEKSDMLIRDLPSWTRPSFTAPS
jgi:hypothetical protein